MLILSFLSITPYFFKHSLTTQAVKNKYAQLMALIVKTEYPDQWPTFFRDLLDLLNGAGPPVVDLFLRVIKAVDEEVVSHEIQR
jgi:exportin-T